MSCAKGVGDPLVHGIGLGATRAAQNSNPRPAAEKHDLVSGNVG
jgi:hypothetical protein